MSSSKRGKNNAGDLDRAINTLAALIFKHIQDNEVKYLQTANKKPGDKIPKSYGRT